MKSQKLTCAQATQKLNEIKNAEADFITLLNFALNKDTPPEVKETSIVQVKTLHEKLKRTVDSFQKEIFWSKIEQAQEAIGTENFIGPEQIHEFIPINFDDVPKIPYSIEELKKAKEQGIMLVLRLDTDEKGKKLTGLRLNGILSPHLKPGHKLFQNTDFWSESFFTTEVCRPGWKLVTQEVLKTSVGKNLIVQTRMLRDKAKSEGILSVEDEQECSNEVLDQFLTDLWSLTRRSDAMKRLSQLAVNQKYRPTFIESLWDTVLSSYILKKNRLARTSLVTSTTSSDGTFVSLGHVSSFGINVDQFTWADDNVKTIGTVFTR